MTTIGTFFDHDSVAVVFPGAGRRKVAFVVPGRTSRTTSIN